MSRADNNIRLPVITENKPCLTCDNDLSRPNKNTNWEYNFFVDFLGHYSNSKIKSVLDTISKNTLFLKIIGSYPVADLD